LNEINKLNIQGFADQGLCPISAKIRKSKL